MPPGQGRKKMGINVSTAMGFENRESLKQTAKNILQKKGSASSDAEKTAEKAVYTFFEDPYTGATVLKASKQIRNNNSLNETLNYLKAHANDRRKKEYIFGELWQTISDKKDSYNSELTDFVVDFNTKNIFAA